MLQISNSCGESIVTVGCRNVAQNDFLDEPYVEVLFPVVAPELMLLGMQGPVDCGRASGSSSQPRPAPPAAKSSPTGPSASLLLTAIATSLRVFPLRWIMPIEQLTLVGENKAAVQAMDSRIIDLPAPRESGINAAETRDLAVLGSGGP